MKYLTLHRSWIFGIALALVTVGSYIPVMRSGGFIWDDDDHIVHPRVFSQAHPFQKIWFEIGATQQYYPLVFTTFALERKLFGTAPRAFHVTNVLLHAGSVILLWRLLRRLRVRAAWMIAAIFAVHPVMVESVAWASERKNVLALFFSLCFAHVYLRSEIPELFSRCRRGFYFLAFVFFSAAMFSKTVACTLPPAMLVIIWWKRGELRARDFVGVLPFIVGGVLLGMLTAYLERTQIGATGALFNLTLLERITIAGRALWFYAAKLIWPIPLIFSYPRWHIDQSGRWQLLFPISVIAVILSLWFLRNKIGRAPLAAVLIFAGLLTPALGFVNIFPMKFSFVADHFQYFASIALISLFVSALAIWSDRLNISLVAQRVCAGIIIALLAILTIRQQAIYRDAESLWLRTAALNPTSALALDNLSGILLRNQKFYDASQAIQTALRIDSNDRTAWFNMGFYDSAMGDREQAVASFRRAIKIDPLDAESHRMIGLEYEKMGRLDLAILEYRQAVAISANNVSYYNNLAIALAKSGQLSEAENVLLRAEMIDRYAPTNFNLALLYMKLQRPTDVIRQLEGALKIDPSFAPARSMLEKVNGAATPGASH